MFLLLAETTGKILQTTLRSSLKIVHRNNVPLLSNESYFFFSKILHLQLKYVT